MNLKKSDNSSLQEESDHANRNQQESQTSNALEANIRNSPLRPNQEERSHATQPAKIPTPEVVDGESNDADRAHEKGLVKSERRNIQDSKKKGTGA